jgi:hypothetical protein
MVSYATGVLQRTWCRQYRGICGAREEDLIAFLHDGSHKHLDTLGDAFSDNDLISGDVDVVNSLLLPYDGFPQFKPAFAGRIIVFIFFDGFAEGSFNIVWCFVIKSGGVADV